MATILVADDNPLIRAALAMALPQFMPGCTIQTAENGMIAVRIFNSSLPISAVITDLSMPVMDGYRFIEYVRSHRPETPVVVITGQTTGERDCKRLRELGVVRCFEKPFELAEVARTLTSFISREADVENGRVSRIQEEAILSAEPAGRG